MKREKTFLLSFGDGEIRLPMGIDGSKARHKSMQQYYNETKKLADSLKAEVVDLLRQKETAQEKPRLAKKEIQTEKQKGTATTAAANIAESAGSLFGSNTVKTLERETPARHRKVATHGENIEALQTRIQTMQTDHSMQENFTMRNTDGNSRPKKHGSSDERPDGRDEAGSYHRPKAHNRVV